MNNKKELSVLFVCMNNICRSPTAEGTLRHLLKAEALHEQVTVDSAGTHGYHAGEGVDSRTRQAATLRGYDLSHVRARKVVPQDMEDFDLILAMDEGNMEYLQKLVMPCKTPRIELFMNYARYFDEREVPDPFYGLGFGFDLVLDMIEDASEGLMAHLKQELSKHNAWKS